MKASAWLSGGVPNHRVAVLLLEGAKPLDVGIPAQVFSNRSGMPYEVRVCGAAPGLVAGGDGLSYHVADGLAALARADTGSKCFTKKSDEVSPIPVVSNLTAQNTMVMGGTREGTIPAFQWLAGNRVVGGLSA
jgi:hypothetical protein